MHLEDLSNRITMLKKIILIIISLAIWFLAFIGINGTYPLAKSQLAGGDICPKILEIPACYLILGGLVLLLISQLNLFRDRARLFFLGAGIPLAIAAFASYGQYMGSVQCPKASDGTPMCYLSLALFSGLFLLKFLEIFVLKRRLNQKLRSAHFLKMKLKA